MTYFACWTDFSNTDKIGALALVLSILGFIVNFLYTLVKTDYKRPRLKINYASVCSVFGQAQDGNSYALAVVSLINKSEYPNTITSIELQRLMYPIIAFRSFLFIFRKIGRPILNIFSYESDKTKVKSFAYKNPAVDMEWTLDFADSGVLKNYTDIPAFGYTSGLLCFKSTGSLHIKKKRVRYRLRINTTRGKFSKMITFSVAALKFTIAPNALQATEPIHPSRQ